MGTAGWRRIKLGAVLVGLLAGVMACGGGDGDGSAAEAPAAPAGDSTLAQGRRVYVSSCAECHGMTGGGRASGQVAPSLRDVDERLTFDQQVDLVRRGRGLMPPQETVLDPGEIDAVVRYERSVF